MDAIEAIRVVQVIENFVNQLSRKRKIYDERYDPFTQDDSKFKKRYRFNKETVVEITNLIRDELSLDPRGKGTTPELQVLVALRCWGRRQVQDDAGDMHGLSQSTVSRICAQVAACLASRASIYINMPSSLNDQAQVIQKFKRIRNFPGVIGAIDCTHIKIKKVGGDRGQYYINRKGYFSLNVQVVCDADLKINDIVARWRGSTHDARIFNESVIKERFEAREFRGRLLGDSGYALRPYLFTPLASPQTPNEECYNAAQIATRNVVERCFGVWKQRFRCLLHGVPVSLSNSKTLIVALAVLHNIARDMNDSLPGTQTGLFILSETRQNNDDINDSSDEDSTEDESSSSDDSEPEEIEVIPANATERHRRSQSAYILRNFINRNFANNRTE